MIKSNYQPLTINPLLHSPAPPGPPLFSYAPSPHLPQLPHLLSPLSPRLKKHARDPLPNPMARWL